MKLSAPKQITFWIAVAVAVLGLIAFLVPSIGFAAAAFWLLALGFVILALGNLLSNL